MKPSNGQIKELKALDQRDMSKSHHRNIPARGPINAITTKRQHISCLSIYTYA
jgi:hypothetical protein